MNEMDKLFSVRGIDYNEVVVGIREEWVGNIKSQHPDIPDSIFDQFRSIFDKHKDVEELRAIYKKVYQRHYTQEDIAGFVKFYESPLGQKSIKVDPLIMEECMANSQAYFESLLKETWDELLAEYS